MLGLDQLDTVLAFTGVMLLLSIVITAIVQIIGSLCNTRGWVLLHGVKQVLLQVAPDLNAAGAKALASKVLAHPAVSHQFLGRHAVAITAVELDKLLDSFLHRPAASDAKPEQSVAAALDILAKSIGEDPDALRARINEWFDTIMKRSSELFTAWSQGITVLVAGALVCVWQIDALTIFQTLRNDRDLRANWLVQSQRLLDEGDLATKHQVALEQLVATTRQRLAADALIPPAHASDTSGKKPSDAEFNLRRLSGGVIAWLLLSLGAPFWFNLLRTLSNLRPSLARKTDEAQAAQGDRP